MTVVDRRGKLFEQVVRLRRAERELPGSADLAIVRGQLEADLGVVPVASAARILGVTHTTVQRWMKAGAIPQVEDVEGRRGVPVSALLALYDEVQAERESGRRRRHFIEPAVRAAEDRADRIDTAVLLNDVEISGEGHGRSQRQSLAYHRLVAKSLRRSTADRALQRLLQWRQDGRIDPVYADRWEKLLRGPLVELRRTLRDPGQDASDLRQSSPFAGTLSEAERRKLLQEVR